MTKKRLGRGLDALMGREEGGYEAAALDGLDIVKASLDRVDPNPFQPRRHFDAGELNALAESIQQHGILQPILIRAVGERFQLIAGERRFRAAQQLGLADVPARLLDLDDRRVAELAMVENLQREDLNPLEKATAFRDYLKTYQVTQEELASRLGIDRSTVANLVRLLELPEVVQEAVRTRKISQGHARALLSLTDAEARISACERIIQESLSVRQTEALVATGIITPSKSRIRAESGHDHAAPAKQPHFVAMEEHLRERFGTPVTIKAKSQDKGQIIIDFNNGEEFERVMTLIRSF